MIKDRGRVICCEAIEGLAGLGVEVSSEKDLRPYEEGEYVDLGELRPRDLLEKGTTCIFRHMCEVCAGLHPKKQCLRSPGRGRRAINNEDQLNYRFVG